MIKNFSLLNLQPFCNLIQLKGVYSCFWKNDSHSTNASKQKIWFFISGIFSFFLCFTSARTNYHQPCALVKTQNTVSQLNYCKNLICSSSSSTCLELASPVSILSTKCSQLKLTRSYFIDWYLFAFFHFSLRSSLLCGYLEFDIIAQYPFFRLSNSSCCSRLWSFKSFPVSTLNVNEVLLTLLGLSGSVPRSMILTSQT